MQRNSHSRGGTAAGTRVAGGTEAAAAAAALVAAALVVAALVRRVDLHRRFVHNCHNYDYTCRSHLASYSEAAGGCFRSLVAAALLLVLVLVLVLAVAVGAGDTARSVGGGQRCCSLGPAPDSAEDRAGCDTSPSREGRHLVAAAGSHSPLEAAGSSGNGSLRRGSTKKFNLPKQRCTSNSSQRNLLGKLYKLFATLDLRSLV